MEYTIMKIKECLRDEQRALFVKLSTASGWKTEEEGILWLTRYALSRLATLDRDRERQREMKEREILVCSSCEGDVVRLKAIRAGQGMICSVCAREREEERKAQAQKKEQAKAAKKAPKEKPVKAATKSEKAPPTPKPAPVVAPEAKTPKEEFKAAKKAGKAAKKAKEAPVQILCRQCFEGFVPLYDSQICVPCAKKNDLQAIAQAKKANNKQTAMF